MTKQEWQESTDVLPMLRFTASGTSRRKLGLLLHSAIHRHHQLVLDRRSLEAIKLADEHLENPVHPGRIDPILRDAETAIRESPHAPGFAAEHFARFVNDYLLFVTRGTNGDVIGILEWFLRAAMFCWVDSEAHRIESRRQESALLADHLRDIIRNPYTLGWVDPDWKRWNDETIVRFATSIHQTGCYEEMPIFGDALEEAGCDDEQILDHCRADQEHVRGCWVIDLVLGRL